MNSQLSAIDKSPHFDYCLVVYFFISNGSVGFQYQYPKTSLWVRSVRSDTYYSICFWSGYAAQSIFSLEL